MKKYFVFIAFVLAFFSSVMTQALKATKIDTLWIRDMWRGYEEDIIRTMVSSDDSLIFVGYKKPAKIEVYNALNGDSIRTLTFPRSESIMDDYDISKDCKYVMACENGDTANIIHVWDMKTGNHLRTIFENDTNFTSFRRFDFLRITPDSKFIFTVIGGKQYRNYKGEWVDSTSRIFVIDTNNWLVQREIKNEFYDVFEYSPTNVYYADLKYRNYVSRIELRDIMNDTLIATFVDSSNANTSYTDLKFSPDSNYIMCHGGNYWYIWKIGQQNYFRRYLWNGSKSLIPNCFLYESGKISSIKYDTLTKTVRTIFYDFINDSIIHNFNISNQEVNFFKSNSKFLIRYGYSLFLIDSTWSTSVFNNEEHHSDFIVVPNPAKDFIEISVGVRHAEPLQSEVRIYDVFGQIVNITPALSILGEGVKIDISTLEPGMYFVRIGDRISKYVKI